MNALFPTHAAIGTQLRAVALDALKDVAPSLFDLLKAASLAVDTDSAAAKSSLARACALLEVALERGKVVGASSGGLASWQMMRLNRYIDAHIDRSILVDDLSSLVGLSCNYFNRAFKRTFGETPHSHVTRRRVELASRLLLTTDDALSDVALACGFSDQAHLCRLFRQHFDTTPSAWRRERRQRTQESAGVGARPRRVSSVQSGYAQ